MKRYEDMCTERAKGDAHCQEPAHDASWWISRVLTLPPDRCTGWVLAQTLVETAKDHKIVTLMHKSTFDKRMRQVGLGNLSDAAILPRKRCEIPRTSDYENELVDIYNAWNSFTLIPMTDRKPVAITLPPD